MATLPSCLDMVNRVLEECGDLEVSSLNPGTRNSKIALEGLNDAQTVIWQRQRWPWQRIVTNIPLVYSSPPLAMALVRSVDAAKTPLRNVSDPATAAVVNCTASFATDKIAIRTSLFASVYQPTNH